MTLSLNPGGERQSWPADFTARSPTSNSSLYCKPSSICIRGFRTIDGNDQTSTLSQTLQNSCHWSTVGTATLFHCLILKDQSASLYFNSPSSQRKQFGPDGGQPSKTWNSFVGGMVIPMCVCLLQSGHFELNPRSNPEKRKKPHSDHLFVLLAGGIGGKSARIRP